MIDINSLEDIVKYSDWLASGGKKDDPYVKQQFRYAENIVNAVKGTDYDGE